MSSVPAAQTRRSFLTHFEWASLRVWLPVAILVFVALSRLYTYQTAIEQGKEEVMAEVQRSQNLLAMRLQSSIEDSLREQELNDVERHLTILNAAPEIKTALLADEHGKIVAANHMEWIGQDATVIDAEAVPGKATSGRTWVASGRNWVLSAYPVVFNLTVKDDGLLPTRAGMLFIATDPALLLAQREAHTRAWMRKSNWVVLALALLGWLFVHFLVSRRIGKLMDVVGRFDQGIVNVTSGVSGKDEIGRLGMAFDRMVRTQVKCSLKARKLAQAVEQSAASVIITDLNGRIEYVNAAFTVITGYSMEEAIGNSTSMLSAGQTSPEQYKDLWDTIKAGGTWRGEMLNRRKNGELYWDSVVISPVYDGDNITHFVAVQEDITARKETELKLLLNMHILNSISEGVAVTDSEQKFCYVNPAFTAITGYSSEEVIGSSPKLLSSGLMEKTFYGMMWGSINETGRWQGEIIDRRKNGESYPEWLSISVIKDERGDISRYVSVFADISERKAAERRMAHMAQHDFLTGLPNRMLLLDRLTQAIAHAERDGHKVAVMFLDLDRFKNINDTLGHAVGDKLLQEVAGRIGRVSRTGDTICRLGGDEFVVMLPRLRPGDNISAIAEKLLESVAGSCVIDGNEIEVTTSIGISLFPDDGGDSGSLLKHADSAMYHAKESGRNNYRFFTSEMNRRVLERVSLEKRLRRALARNEFMLHYQPQLDLHTGRLVGVEALLRWQDPEVGTISPGQFISIAEENGLIIPIGEWVLREACREKAKWLRLGLPEIVMSVNLSAVQFRQKNLGEVIISILKENDLAPSGLELEITESAVMRDAEAAIVLLNDLQEMGVKLAMDDFGTGYSSLSYLKRLPIDKLKIDQSFVRDVSQDPDDAAIVRTIISMAHSLKLKVTAEGVENDGQLAFLNQHGCTEGQGFYFCNPLPADEFVAYYRKHLQS